MGDALRIPNTIPVNPVPNVTPGTTELNQDSGGAVNMNDDDLTPTEAGEFTEVSPSRYEADYSTPAEPGVLTITVQDADGNPVPITVEYNESDNLTPAQRQQLLVDAVREANPDLQFVGVETVDGEPRFKFQGPEREVTVTQPVTQDEINAAVTNLAEQNGIDASTVQVSEADAEGKVTLTATVDRPLDPNNPEDQAIIQQEIQNFAEENGLDPADVQIVAGEDGPQLFATVSSLDELIQEGMIDQETLKQSGGDAVLGDDGNTITYNQGRGEPPITTSLTEVQQGIDPYIEGNSINFTTTPLSTADTVQFVNDDNFGGQGWQGLNVPVNPDGSIATDEEGNPIINRQTANGSNGEELLGNPDSGFVLAATARDGNHLVQIPPAIATGGTLIANYQDILAAPDSELAKFGDPAQIKAAAQAIGDSINEKDGVEHSLGGFSIANSMEEIRASLPPGSELIESSLHPSLVPGKEPGDVYFGEEIPGLPPNESVWYVTRNLRTEDYSSDFETGPNPYESTHLTESSWDFDFSSTAEQLRFDLADAIEASTRDVFQNGRQPKGETRPILSDPRFGDVRMTEPTLIEAEDGSKYLTGIAISVANDANTEQAVVYVDPTIYPANTPEQVEAAQEAATTHANMVVDNMSDMYTYLSENTVKYGEGRNSVVALPNELIDDWNNAITGFTVNEAGDVVPFEGDRYGMEGNGLPLSSNFGFTTMADGTSAVDALGEGVLSQINAGLNEQLRSPQVGEVADASPEVTNLGIIGLMLDGENALIHIEPDLTAPEDGSFGFTVHVGPGLPNIDGISNEQEVQALLANPETQTFQELPEAMQQKVIDALQALDIEDLPLPSRTVDLQVYEPSTGGLVPQTSTTELSPEEFFNILQQL